MQQYFKWALPTVSSEPGHYRCHVVKGNPCLLQNLKLLRTYKRFRMITSLLLHFHNCPYVLKDRFFETTHVTLRDKSQFQYKTFSLQEQLRKWFLMGQSSFKWFKITSLVNLCNHKYKTQFMFYKTMTISSKWCRVFNK